MGKSDYKLKTVTSELADRVQSMCDDTLVTMLPDGSIVYKAHTYSVGKLVLGIVFVGMAISAFIHESELSIPEIVGLIVFVLAGIALLISALHRVEIYIDTVAITIARSMFGMMHKKFVYLESIHSVDVFHKGELENSERDVFVLHLILNTGKRYRWLSCSGSEPEMNMVRDIILCYKHPSTG